MNLEIPDKEFFALLGPSGCGKTTALRLIAGLEKPTSGNIYFDGQPINDVPIRDRNVSMVFQTFALWPHMSVFDNIAFPLRMYKYPAQEIRKKVKEVAEMLQISHLLKRKPGELSGGEAQRVGLGRAIVRSPNVFLMDEPLANLDAKLRAAMRIDLKKLQRTLGVTAIYVTHDQVEAMAMAQRIAVMKSGKIMQVGTHSELYDRPRNIFVASFIGSPPMNFIDCTFDEEKGILASNSFTLRLPSTIKEHLSLHAAKSELILGIRPKDISIHDKDLPDSIAAEVYAIEPLGDEFIVDLQLNGSLIRTITLTLPYPTLPARLQEGQKLWIKFKMEEIRIYDKRTEDAII